MTRSRPDRTALGRAGDSELRFFYGLLLALAVSAAVWLGLGIAVYALVAY